ncbi:hypothetical protein F4859DRAFT_108237 [Xylaria cf. heliscus]|nr:hypothetical protein F4859DRAFT_108237 [Xylaria cf. heliscus]
MGRHICQLALTATNTCLLGTQCSYCPDLCATPNSVSVAETFQMTQGSSDLSDLSGLEVGTQAGTLRCTYLLKYSMWYRGTFWLVEWINHILCTERK